MSDRLFISHASADGELTRALTELLRLGGGVAVDEIFCSSLDDTSIPPGQDFVEHIRAQMTEAVLVVQLFTPAYMESAFCLCELGAQWALSREAFPLVVPPLSSREVSAVLRQVHVARIDNGYDLDKLFEAVCKHFRRNPNVVNWNVQRERFLGELPTRLLAVARATKVSAERYDRAVAALQAERTRATQLEQHVEELERNVKELAAVKDARAVAKILADKDAWARLHQLAYELHMRLVDLPHCVREVMITEEAHASYTPESIDEEPLIQAAILDGYLYEVDDWPHPRVALNAEDPQVSRALEVLKQMKQLVDGAPELRHAFAAKHDVALDFGNRRTWSALEI